MTVSALICSVGVKHLIFPDEVTVFERDDERSCPKNVRRPDEKEFKKQSRACETDSNPKRCDHVREKRNSIARPKHVCLFSNGIDSKHKQSHIGSDGFELCQRKPLSKLFVRVHTGS